MKLILSLFCFSLLITLHARDWQDIDFTQLDQLINKFINDKIFPGKFSSLFHFFFFLHLGAVIGIYQKNFAMPSYRNYGHFEYPEDQFPAPV